MKKITSCLFLGLIIIFLGCQKDKTLEPPFDISEAQTNWTKIKFDTLKFAPEFEFHGVIVTDVCFVDALTGFIAGYKINHENASFIFKTIDGGNTWFGNYGYGCGAGSHCRSVNFFDANNGFATFSCLGNRFAQTANGGVNWVKNVTYLPNDVPNLNHVIDEFHAIIGDLKTSDAGETWQTVSPPIGASAYFFYDLTFGVCATKEGQILKSTDFGETWTIIYDNPSSSFSAITLLNDQTILAGGNQLVKSVDQGENWTTVSEVSHLNDLKFVNESIGFAAVSNRPLIDGDFVYETDLKGSILKTTDGGETWSINYQSELIGFNALSVLDENTIIAVGTQSRENEQVNAFIVKTTTQGN
jgi:photosystem II stability/assembly factor-like uncharacterized protein